MAEQFCDGDAMAYTGPEGEFRRQALNAAPWVRDAQAIVTQTGAIQVTVVRVGENPVPSHDELEDVRTHLVNDAESPLIYSVQVFGPEVLVVGIDARLTVHPGVNAARIITRVRGILTRWFEQERMLGMMLRRSEILARLMNQEGVRAVELNAPSVDILLGPTQVYVVEVMNISVEAARDE